MERDEQFRAVIEPDALLKDVGEANEKSISRVSGDGWFPASPVDVTNSYPEDE